MAAKIFRINYKSDFILTMNSEAGWTIPFCIKFWTSIPMRAYYVGFDGTTYTHCAYDPAEPTKLLVQFDDHHLPIGNLHFQIAYHFTVEDFPNNTEDEVFNATAITTEIDGETYQVMLDFTGETAPGIDFNMPSVGVTSVNGKIGAVTLNAEDVGAQPTIEDLATIRSGAAEGATAVQPAELQQGLATKQNVIEDLATIRSGAAAGATAVQPAAMNTALAAKQDTLTFDNTPTANSSNPVKSSGIKTALDAKQSTISTVNVTVDNNTGTPSGSASVSGSTLSLSFQNLKGATGATGATGPQGPQGERGLPGESGVTGDVSGFTVIQTIDPSATYGATDIAGAAALQAANAELTELAGIGSKAVGKTVLISGWSTGCRINDNVEVGTVVDKTKGYDATKRCVEVAVNEGESLIVNGYSATNALLWVFIDDEDKLISKAIVGADVSDNKLKIGVPKNAAHAIINQSNGSNHSWLDCYVVKHSVYGNVIDNLEVEKVTSSNINLINPSNVTVGYYLGPSLVLQENSALSVSDYIPVNGQNIVSNGRGISTIGIVVYDKNFGALRFIGSDAYTYQDGDAYIRISFLNTTTNKMANYGTTLLEYVPYNPIDTYLDNVKQEISTQSGKIESLESAVESLVILDSYKNTELTLIQDGAIVGIDGSISSSQYTSNYEVRSIDVSNIDFTYIKISGTFSGVGYLVAGGYDLGGTCIKKYLIKSSGTQSLSLKVPKENDGVVTLKFTIQKAYSSLWNLSVYSVGDALIESVKFVEGDKVYEHYIDVIPSATGDNSLVGVLKSLMADTSDEKPSYQHRYTIRLTAGTYNVDCSEETLNSTRGLYLMPYTTIVGQGRDATKLQFLYAGNSDDIMSNYSGLNIVYTCWVKNLSIEVENIRYAVHSDLTESGFPDTAGSDMFFENVAIIHHGITNGDTPTYNAPSAWGGGSNNGQKKFFKNCLFEAYTFDAFSNHDRDGFTDEQYFTFESCDFISHNISTDFSSSYGKATVFLNSWGSGAKIYANFINCRINKWVELYETSDVDSHYILKFDNNQLVHIKENTANPQKKKHYSTGSCREFLFDAATSMGSPIVASSALKAAAFDGSGSSKAVIGVLIHDAGAGEFGTVMMKGIFPQAQILGTTFAIGKLIGWNGSAWVEDNVNPILVAKTNTIAEIL